MVLPETAATLLDRVRPPKGVAAVAIVDTTGEAEIFCPERVASRLFEFGSLTKTLTATLLATLVVDGQLSLDTEVGDIIGAQAGGAAKARLGELATHTSGLPRLAPNSLTIPFWPRDPYRFYGEKRLLEGLARVELKERGVFGYSNLGYMLLGFCLATATGHDFATVLTARVLEPAGMTTARSQPCPRRGLLRGHGPLLLGGRRWHHPLPGAGGVDGTIADLAQWARTNLLPESTSLEAAVRLAQQVHASHEERRLGLGWHFSESIVWHNGATGAFQAMLAIEPGKRAVAGLATLGPSKMYALDAAILEWFRSVA